MKAAEEAGEDPLSAIKTLYIDRDPVTFKDISLHLQGYHVQPRDGTHFVRLFADAQFYSLPRLISQLYEESIFMSIGHREFQIPRDLFQDPGNSPNFFSLGFAIFFSSPDDLFPGLDREGLIRPPSILPPSVPHRSADTFAELLHLLRGYPVNIRDAAHRASLLRDCRYFNFKGLEQRLIPHALSWNQARRRDEISLRLDDILKSGITVQPEATAQDPRACWVMYARPFVDDHPAELVLEIGGENTRLHLSSMRAEFFRDARTRISRMFEVIATKLSLPPTTQPLGLLMHKGGAGSQPATPGNTPLSEDHVRVLIDPDTAITLDGKPYSLPYSLSDMLDDQQHQQLLFQQQQQQQQLAASAPLQRRRHRPRRHRVAHLDHLRHGLSARLQLAEAPASRLGEYERRLRRVDREDRPVAPAHPGCQERQERRRVCPGCCEAGRHDFRALAQQPADLPERNLASPVP